MANPPFRNDPTAQIDLRDVDLSDIAADSDPDALTIVRDGSSYKLRSHKLGIEVIEGPDKGSSREFAGPDVRVGRSPHCDLVLNDGTVSRHHLTLSVQQNGLKVSDSGSRNSVILDGVRVRDAWARPESVIQIGNSAIRIKLLAEFAEIELPSRTRFGEIIGESVPMRRLFGVLEKLAQVSTTVLIEGETGTGKELVAEALHDEGPRAQQPLVVFDCSAISPALIESELAGHKRGSFTGATSDRMGAFESANGGTLFIDEVGELPLDLQPKLLRMLEQREVRPIGSDKVRRADVRIIAATNRSLQAEVDGGRFREDLYYRLAVARVQIPPLRERLDDIPLLLEYFYRQLATPNTPPLDRELVRTLQTRSWPGNVRQLRNAIETLLSGAEPAVDEHPPQAAGQIDLSVPFKVAQERFEQAYVEAAMKASIGNVSKAAELAGINRRFIQRVLKRQRLKNDP